VSIPRDQAEARAMIDPGCLEVGVASPPTHAVRVTGRTMEAAEVRELDAVNAWLESRLGDATWTRVRALWPPNTDVITTTDAQAAGVLAALEQYGAAAALRLIALINAMPDPEGTPDL
jgi:hypothetical protein